MATKGDKVDIDAIREKNRAISAILNDIDWLEQKLEWLKCYISEHDEACTLGEALRRNEAELEAVEASLNARV